MYVCIYMCVWLMMIGVIVAPRKALDVSVSDLEIVSGLKSRDKIIIAHLGREKLAGLSEGDVGTDGSVVASVDRNMWVEKVKEKLRGSLAQQGGSC
jgi:hypothetical protein